MSSSTCSRGSPPFFTVSSFFLFLYYLFSPCLFLPEPFFRLPLSVSWQCLSPCLSASVSVCLSACLSIQGSLSQSFYSDQLPTNNCPFLVTFPSVSGAATAGIEQLRGKQTIPFNRLPLSSSYRGTVLATELQWRMAGTRSRLHYYRLKVRFRLYKNMCEHKWNWTTGTRS